MASFTDARRRRLLYRSSYTGTKETDLLLGQFARAHLATFSNGELDRFERLIENADPDLYMWISGRRPVPREWDNDVMQLLKEFKVKI